MMLSLAGLEVGDEDEKQCLSRQGRVGEGEDESEIEMAGYWRREQSAKAGGSGREKERELAVGW